MMTTPRVLPRRLGVLTAISATLGLLFLLSAPPAAAHTRLLESTPGKDSTVSAVPEVTLLFSEPVRMPKVLVRDASGALRHVGAPRTDGATVIQPVAGGLAPGRYTVAYRVIAVDGHRLEEQFAFTLTGGTGAAGAPGAAATGPAAAGTSAAGTSAAGTSGAVRPGVAAADPAKSSVAEPEDVSGGTKWSLIVAGLMLGVAIGAAVTFLRRRPGPPGRPGTPGRPGDAPGEADDRRGSSGGE